MTTRWGRHSLAPAAAILAALAFGLSAPASTGAQPATTPTPLCCVPASPVTAVAVSGTTAYIGGSFRHVGSYTGSFAAIDPGSGRAAAGRAVVDGRVNASVGDGAGGWYIGGLFTSVDGVPRKNLAHLHADGSLDTAWAPSIDGGGEVHAVAISGGTLFAGGSFTSVNGGVGRSNLAAFQTTSGELAGFSGAVNGAVMSLAATSAAPTAGGDPARLYVGGSFTEAGGQPRTRIAAFQELGGAGALDPGFAPAVDGAVSALLVRTDGALDPVHTIYAGGHFTKVGPTSRVHLAAFDTDGALKAWNAAAVFPVVALARGSSKIYAGSAPANSGLAGPRLQGFNEDTGTSDAGFAASVGVGDVRALSVIGSTVYLGGSFSSVNGVPRTHLAAVAAADGATTDWDPEATHQVLALAHDGSTLHAGGAFVSVGGVRRNRLAAIDLTTGELTAFDPDLNGPVLGLLHSGSTLYAGGQFTAVNGATPRRRLAGFATGTGAATPFDPDVNGDVRALAAVGGQIIAGGSFTQVNGAVPRTNLARFDGGSGNATGFAPKLDGDVSALATRGSTIYAGGAFTQAAGQNRRRLAAFAENGAATIFDPDADGQVTALAIDGSTVYAGGAFTTVNGTTTRRRLAGFDADSGAATGFNPDLDPSVALGSSVAALAFADGRVFAGGPFGHEAGTAGPPYLAAFDPSTGAASAWAPRPDAAIWALAASPEGGLVVGGSFGRLRQPPFHAAGVTAFALSPAAPAAPAAAPGDGQASVEVAAAPSGGSPVNGYTITASPGGRTVTASGPGSIVVGGLANGTTYTFRATASNAVGTSPPSAPSNPVTPSGAPSAVTPPGAPGTAAVAAPPASTLPVSSCGRLTSKLSLARATFSRRGRTLSVLAPITRLASGSVQITLSAAGRTTTFRAPIDSRNGRIRVTRRITAAQARLGTGILTIRYGGDADTRPQNVRLRAANHHARLTVTRPQITQSGFLRASGTLTTAARGVVRVQLEYVNRSDGETVTLQRVGRVSRGRWHINSKLSPSLRTQISQRCGTVHSYTLFTGYLPRGMRGEMRALQVLPTQ